MIMANYISAWFGGFFLMQVIGYNLEITIENGFLWLLALIFLAFLITLIIELPFFLFALRKIERFFKRGLYATVIVNLVSYLCLIGWYFLASDTSMLTRLSVVPVSEISMPNKHAIYFIASHGEGVVKSDLYGKSPTVVKSIATQGRDSLVVRKVSDVTYDLFLRRNRDPKDEELIAKDISSLPFRRSEREEAIDRESGVIPAPNEEFERRYGPIIKLGIESAWEYWDGFGLVDMSIYGKNKDGKQHFRYSLETPFWEWSVRSATHIAGDLAIFQLGDDQICVLDPSGKKIALIARGREPVVVGTKP